MRSREGESFCFSFSPSRKRYLDYHALSDWKGLGEIVANEDASMQFSNNGPLLRRQGHGQPENELHGSRRPTAASRVRLDDSLEA